MKGLHAPEAVVEQERERAPEAQGEQVELAPEAAVELDPQVLEQDPEGQEAPEALEGAFQVMEAGEDPQVREALEVLDRLLSHCVRRLDTMVQVGTGRALLGRQQLWERLGQSLLVSSKT